MPASVNIMVYGLEKLTSFISGFQEPVNNIPVMRVQKTLCRGNATCTMSHTTSKGQGGKSGASMANVILTMCRCLLENVLPGDGRNNTRDIDKERNNETWHAAAYLQTPATYRHPCPTLGD